MSYPSTVERLTLTIIGHSLFGVSLEKSTGERALFPSLSVCLNTDQEKTSLPPHTASQVESSVSDMEVKAELLMYPSPGGFKT